MSRRYWIRLRGFDGHEVIADTAAKAKAKTFRAWLDAGFASRPGYTPDSPFKQFIDQIEVVYALGPVALTDGATHDR